MSNPEHLAKLKGGVETWNQWRHLNPSIIPDLNGANLSITDLSRDLSGASLRAASLVGSDLRNADLTGFGTFAAFGVSGSRSRSRLAQPLRDVFQAVRFIA